MNASRSRREVTSETSMFDTDNGPSYARLCRWLVRHIISGPLIASPIAEGERIEVRVSKCRPVLFKVNPHPPPLPYEGRGDPSARSAFSFSPPAQIGNRSRLPFRF